MGEKLGHGEERERKGLDLVRTNQSSEKRGKEKLKPILRRTKETHRHKGLRSPKNLQQDK